MGDELGELQEHAEHGKEGGLAAVTLTMAIMAVLVASVTLLGHRAHTEEVLLQSRAADQWAYYQAKDIKQRMAEKFIDMESVFALQSGPTPDAIKESNKKEVEKYAEELKEIQNKAREAEADVKVEAARADRYDLAEVLLEAGLVICSITLLTRKKVFWLMGSLLALGGVVIAVTGVMIH